MSEQIVISAALQTAKENGMAYGAQVYEQLTQLPHIKCLVLQAHKQNVWCRDYLPVKNAKGDYVQFTYAPRYMLDSKKWKERIPIAQDLWKELNIQPTQSDIILDGGNVELHHDIAIISDRVYHDNDAQSSAEMQALYHKLKNTLAVKQLIIVPQHPYDFTGHVDGLVRFINDKTVLINEIVPITKPTHNSYRQKLESAWYYSFISALHNAGLHTETIIYTAGENDNDKSAAGIYLNYLQLEQFILLPTFHQKAEDQQASNTLAKHFPTKKIIPIQANELASQGGIINCVTWSK